MVTDGRRAVRRTGGTERCGHGAVDKAKTRANESELDSLGYVEIAFFVDYGDNLNPFYKNMKPV